MVSLHSVSTRVLEKYFVNSDKNEINVDTLYNLHPPALRHDLAPVAHLVHGLAFGVRHSVALGPGPGLKPRVLASLN